MSDISVEHRGHISVVTLDRPPINSLVRETYIELVLFLGDIVACRAYQMIQVKA